MGRTIVTQRDAELRERMWQAQSNAAVSAGIPSVSTNTPDGYRDRLLKYIPAEIVAIYLALLSLIKTSDPQTTPVITVEWTIFLIVLIVSVPWQRRIMKISKWQQVMIGTIAFVFWAMSLGDPFNTSWKASGYRPLYGTIAMMLYTFLIPLFEAE